MHELELKKEAKRAQPEIFHGRDSFLKLGHFNNYSIKKAQKKDPAGKKFGVFSPRYSENCILNPKFNPKIDTIRAFFFQNQGIFFFQFSKKDRVGL